MTLVTRPEISLVYLNYAVQTTLGIGGNKREKAMTPAQERIDMMIESVVFTKAGNRNMGRHQRKITKPFRAESKTIKGRPRRRAESLPAVNAPQPCCARPAVSPFLYSPMASATRTMGLLQSRPTLLQLTTNSNRFDMVRDRALNFQE